MRVLLGAEAVAQPAFRHNHVVIADCLIFGDIAGQAAPLGQAHGQQVVCCRGLRVVDGSVTGESADAVEHFACIGLPSEATVASLNRTARATVVATCRCGR